MRRRTLHRDCGNAALRDATPLQSDRRILPDDGIDTIDMTNLRRRKLVLGLAAAGATAFGASWLVRRRTHGAHDHAAASAPGAMPVGMAPPQAGHSALRVPGADGLLADLRLTAPVRLQAGVARVSVFAGAATSICAFTAGADGNTMLNPTLHATRGGMLDITLQNHLDEDTTLHWHGLQVDEANDGSGLHPVAPGTERRYRFQIHDRAGLYWYHAHPHGRTGRQLQSGLAGLLLIEDEEELTLRKRLGLDWGTRDLPLMLTDKQVDADNAIVYRDGADDWIGNRVLANWSPEPVLQVEPALYRFRMINVANARMLRPAFLHGDTPLPMRLIGTDGGLLDRPWPIDDLFLAPAQRADVLVDFSGLKPDATVTLRSLDYAAMENEDESGAFMPDAMADHPGAVMMGDALDLMLFRICEAPAICTTRPGTANAGANTVPERLSSLPPPPDTRDWPVRPLRLSMDSEGTWMINDHNFHADGHDSAFEVKRGSREVWEIRNSMTSMPHPIHIHGVQFRVVSRRISPQDIRARKVTAEGLTPQDLGLNDTVVIWPGEIVRIAIDFSQPFSGTQRYMLHCHNLEHEDMGMMLTFAVVD